MNSSESDIEPLVVSVKTGCAVLDKGVTGLYKLIAAGEIQSYRDGRSRKLVLASLKAYVARQLSSEQKKPRKGWTDAATKARWVRKSASGEAAERRQISPKALLQK
jgi:excisionase family DNA binding protein